jgi:putative endonuclease
MPFFVYVLQSESTGETYIGQTSDLQRRVAQHNDPNCQLTLHTKRRRGPWRLVHSEELLTRAEAMRREKELKSGKGREWIRQKIISRAEG